MTYPIHVRLEGRRVLVVGGGPVATRRITTLLAEGADVVVVAPEADERIRAWAADASLAWRPRPFAHSDVIGAWLVHAATDDAEVNRVVVEEASRRGIWSVRADDADASPAATPAVAARGPVTVSVTSGDPARTAAIGRRLQAGLDDGTLLARARRARSRGSVVLIGGGPGDDGLITVQGRQELLQADVVVHDRLAPLGLLALLEPDVEVVDAGKSPGRHALSQDEINALIVDRALAGRRVARLKGGDPFVLGRGSEEVLACHAAGVDVTVVPGVSSAVAAPAAAGIPVTHRGLSTGFVVLSGHEVADLSHVARSGLTVVVLMGVATLPRLVAEFLDAERDPQTPVAVVHRAYGADERTVRGTLADIEARVAAARLANPAVIVVGDVVSAIPVADDLLADVAS